MVALVIVPQEVQQAVQSQNSELDRIAVARLARLPPRDTSRNDDIAQKREGTGGLGDSGTTTRTARE